MQNGETLTDAQPASVMRGSRTRVLGLLRAAPAPLGAQEVAERTGLHPNTARFHLDGLAAAGLAERRSEERDQPGRPRTVYSALPAGMEAGRRSYRLLAEMLAVLVAESVPDPARAALEAGRAWGGYLTERPAPFERVDAGAAVERLIGLLADVGFAPESGVQDDGDEGESPGLRIRLRHCPFREVAERHREVVCSLHLGLLQGALAEMRAPLSAERLDALVEPSLCVARLGMLDGQQPGLSKPREAGE